MLLKLNLKAYVHRNYVAFCTAVTVSTCGNRALNGREDMQPDVCVCQLTSVSPVAQSCKIQANVTSLLTNSCFRIIILNL